MSKSVVINIGEALVGFPPDATEEEKERFAEVLCEELEEDFKRQQCGKIETQDEGATQRQASEVTRQIVVDYNYIIEHGKYTHAYPMVAVNLLRESLGLQSKQ